MADETPAPLSDAEIEVIRADWQAYGQFGSTIALPVGRLLATLAAYREIVAAVAERDILGYMGDAGENVVCPFCNGEEDYSAPSRADNPAYHEFRHEDSCPVTRARALLGTPAPGATGATAGEEGEA